jgi:hypothetical protein
VGAGVVRRHRKELLTHLEDDAVGFRDEQSGTSACETGKEQSRCKHAMSTLAQHGGFHRWRDADSGGASGRGTSSYLQFGREPIGYETPRRMAWWAYGV